MTETAPPLRVRRRAPRTTDRSTAARVAAEAAESAQQAQQVIPIARADAELQDCPVPDDWVVSGHPRARVQKWAQSPDRTTESYVWDCTAGVFRWYFAVDETIHVIDGSVTICAVGIERTPVVLRAGDAAYFRAGTWTLWTVEQYVRKHAVLRVPVPRPLARVVGSAGRRTHRLGGLRLR